MRETREIVQCSCVGRHLVWDYTLRCPLLPQESECSTAQSCVSAHSLMSLLFKLGHCTENTHHVFIVISLLTWGREEH